VVSVTAGVVEPRYTSFMGIMAAKSKPVDECTIAHLGLDAGDVGWAGGGQEIVAAEPAPKREAGEVVEDDGEGYAKIIGFLENLKVI
jgi:electron transfer flavoprotein beta subunit